MAAESAIAGYREALIFLGTAGVVVPLARRLKITPVIGFLLAGVLLGPYCLGRFADQPWAAAITFNNVEQMRHFAELGVVFLLFTIGLELAFERLKAMRRLVFGLGSLQVLLCAAAITLAALLLNVPPTAAVIIGGALALSSTAIVMPILAERKRLATAAGRTSFAILLFQDIMVAPLLFMVAMLGQRSDAGLSAGLGAGLFFALIPALIVLGLIVLLGRLVLRPLFQQVAMTRSTEFFMAACLLVVMGTAMASAAAGLSMALGAFVAGLLLAETEYRREVETTIEPFKGLLLGLFFVSVGASLDINQVIASPYKTIGLAVVLVAGKALIIFLLARAMRFTAPVAQEVALVLGPGGEFAFVMIGAAIAVEAMDRALGSQIMLSVTLSMLAIPGLAYLSGLFLRVQPEPEENHDDLLPDMDENGHVIVVGFGRVGQLVTDMLESHKLPYLAVDGDARLVMRERKFGRQVYWGDATRLEFLRKCGLDGARALVLTMDAPRAVEIIVALVRKERPDITIVARARDAHHATVLYGLGATDAIPETIEASLQLSEALLVNVGVPMGYVIASIHEKRDEYRKILQPAAGAERPQHGIRLSTRVKDMRKEPRPAKDGSGKAAE